MLDKKLFAIIIFSLVLITFISGCIMQTNEQINISNNQTSGQNATESTKISEQEEIPPMPPSE